MTFDSLADKVVMLEQEVSAIAKIQQQQLCTLQRLCDLGILTDERLGIGEELRSYQLDLYEKCNQLEQKVDSIIHIIDRSDHEDSTTAH